MEEAVQTSTSSLQHRRRRTDEFDSETTIGFFLAHHSRSNEIGLSATESRNDSSEEDREEADAGYERRNDFENSSDEVCFSAESD